jgi:hypothetical protein
MMVDVLCDQGRAKASSLVGVLGIEITNGVSFLIGENRKADCSGDVVFLKFRGRTDIDDVWVIRK